MALPTRWVRVNPVQPFSVGGADGGNPFGGLVMDSHGNIFGTTYLGGLQSCGFCGVVFEISPD